MADLQHLPDAAHLLIDQVADEHLQCQTITLGWLLLHVVEEVLYGFKLQRHRLEIASLERILCKAVHAHLVLDGAGWALVALLLGRLLLLGLGLSGGNLRFAFEGRRLITRCLCHYCCLLL